MEKISALHNLPYHKSVLYGAFVFFFSLAAVVFQPMSSYADEFEYFGDEADYLEDDVAEIESERRERNRRVTESRGGFQSEWTIGLEMSFGDLHADIEVDGTRTAQDGTVGAVERLTTTEVEEIGGGAGAFLRYDAHFPNDWIVGGQLTIAYEGYHTLTPEGTTVVRTEIDSALIDLLGRVSYDTRREIRPFIALGPTFLLSEDIRVEDDYLIGIKVGVGVDFVLNAFDGHVVISLGYLHANYFDKDPDPLPMANTTVTGGKYQGESHQGAVSVGYRF